MGRGRKSRIRCRKKERISPVFKDFKKWVLALFGFYMIALFSTRSCAGLDIRWQRSDQGIDELDIKSVCIIEEKPGIVFVGGEKGLYKSIDLGENWERVLLLSSAERRVNCISYNKKNPDIIYAGLSDGLYISLDSGRAWERVFRGKNESDRNIRYIAYDEKRDVLFIATDKGLFESDKDKRGWQRVYLFTNKQVSSIAIKGDLYYVYTDDGVYYRDKVSDWSRIYIFMKGEEEEDEGQGDDIQAEPAVTDLGPLAIEGNRVYVATDNGILTASAGSEEWYRLGQQGLKSKKIDFIIAEHNNLIISSQKGVFVYDRAANKWHDYSIGLSTLKINMIDASSTQDIIFAATKKGLFRSGLDSFVFSDNTQSLMHGISKKEPSIYDIHQAAIRYAEVSPEKIEWMRSAAKNQALIPSFTFKIDRDTSSNLNIDRGGTNDPDFFIEGPRDKKWSWGIGLNWDLSEYVWSYHQTSIDVRSRLMVQLRNDILDQVTKLYFERLRLKNEILQNPAQKAIQLDTRYLRLAELTANIDALTGGYLSRYIGQEADLALPAQGLKSSGKWVKQ
jgi:photosystem II stability/assembly factor-like uncharacterized protein